MVGGFDAGVGGSGFLNVKRRLGRERERERERGRETKTERERERDRQRVRGNKKDKAREREKASRLKKVLCGSLRRMTSGTLKAHSHSNWMRQC